MNPKKNLHVLLILMFIGQRILKTYINDMIIKDNANKRSNEEAFNNQIILKVATKMNQKPLVMVNNVNVIRYRTQNNKNKNRDFLSSR